MNIPNVISPSILQAGLFDTARIQPVDYLFALDTSSDTLTSSSIVDISSLGNLLSAALIVGGGMLQRVATNPDGFATVVAATQFFVDALNGFLQSVFDNSQNLLVGSIYNQFVQMLNEQASVPSGNGESIIASLASVGIDFQAPSDLSGSGQLTIDINALQSAFNADPSGTSSLLTQAVQSIGRLAAEFTGLFVQLVSLVQIGASQDSLIPSALNGTLPSIIAAARSLTAATTPDTTLPSAVNATLAATGKLATTAQTAPMPLAAATTPATIPLLTATGVLTAAELLAMTAQPAVAGLPTTTTQTLAATTLATIPPATANAALAATGQPATAAQPNVTGLPITSTQAAATSATSTIPVTNAIALLRAVELLARTSQPPVSGLPTTTKQAAATMPVATAAGTAAQPSATELLPITTDLPAAPPLTEAIAATPTASTATATVAPVTAPSYIVNPLFVATNPATAAAIAAYHLVGGYFDTGKNYVKGLSPAIFDYGEIWPVTQIRPVKFDIHA